MSHLEPSTVWRPISRAILGRSRRGAFLTFGNREKTPEGTREEPAITEGPPMSCVDELSGLFNASTLVASLPAHSLVHRRTHRPPIPSTLLTSCLHLPGVAHLSRSAPRSHAAITPPPPPPPRAPHCFCPRPARPRPPTPATRLTDTRRAKCGSVVALCALGVFRGGRPRCRNARGFTTTVTEATGAASGRARRAWPAPRGTRNWMALSSAEMNTQMRL